jgi:hypothetical protein
MSHIVPTIAVRIISKMIKSGLSTATTNAIAATAGQRSRRCLTGLLLCITDKIMRTRRTEQFESADAQPVGEGTSAMSMTYFSDMSTLFKSTLASSDVSAQRRRRL